MRGVDALRHSAAPSSYIHNTVTGILVCLRQVWQRFGSEFSSSLSKTRITDGCVAKNMLGHKNTERHFSSGGNFEEIGHESNLSANVAFPESFNLSLPNHVHCLEPADRPPRRLETDEAESGIDSTFYESAPLLDDII
jgi:hypothetical protein